VRVLSSPHSVARGTPRTPPRLRPTPEDPNGRTRKPPPPPPPPPPNAPAPSNLRRAGDNGLTIPLRSRRRRAPCRNPIPTQDPTAAVSMVSMMIGTAVYAPQLRDRRPRARASRRERPIVQGAPGSGRDPRGRSTSPPPARSGDRRGHESPSLVSGAPRREVRCDRHRSSSDESRIVVAVAEGVQQRSDLLGCRKEVGNWATGRMIRPADHIPFPRRESVVGPDSARSTSPSEPTGPGTSVIRAGGGSSPSIRARSGWSRRLTRSRDPGGRSNRVDVPAVLGIYGNPRLRGWWLRLTTAVVVRLTSLAPLSSLTVHVPGYFW